MQRPQGSATERVKVQLNFSILTTCYAAGTGLNAWPCLHDNIFLTSWPQGVQLPSAVISAPAYGLAFTCCSREHERDVLQQMAWHLSVAADNTADMKMSLANYQQVTWKNI